MFKTPKIYSLMSTLLLVSACATSPQMADAPKDPAPQLTGTGQKDASGRELYAWSNAESFGQVKGQQKVLGDASCLMARADLEAAGYHPMAKDASGKTIVGGGYFCVVKANGDKPAAEAPMLVRTAGVLGWDRPSAFGSVPPSEQARGNALCAKAQAGYEAAAYHPQAKDQMGKPIAGGGFFCAPKRDGVRAMS